MLLSLGLLVAFAPTLLAECPPDTIYETFFDKCYKYYNSPLPFLAAERQCNSIGGNLVAVQSGFENSYVSGIASGASGRTPNFWIGANQLLSASWLWTYNTSMSYTNWASGQPGASYPCGLIRDSDSKWISGACNSALPFVCSVDPNAPQPGYCPTPQPAPTCPFSSCSDDAICSPGYTLYVGNCICYKYVEGSFTYSDATTACANESATLVKIDSPELNEYLTNLPGFDCWSSECPWIGLTCINQTLTSCSWPDGSVPVYTNFRTRAPNNVNERLYLAANNVASDTEKWDVEQATDRYSFLCQKPSTRSSLLKTVARQKIQEKTYQRTGATSVH